MPLRNSVGAAVCAAMLFAGGTLISGCGAPPDLRPTPGPPSPTPTMSPSAPGLPPGFSISPSLLPPSPAAFPDTTTAPCAGKPTVEQIITLVKKTIPIPSGTTATLGPLCSGTWQYTILQVPGAEPLQVVSSGQPKALTLVAAGTDICTIEVRNYAPPGIRVAANC